MNLGMTIDAAAADAASITRFWDRPKGQTLCRLELGRVIRESDLGVALLTQKRR